jgi:hypothetical protein
MTFEWKTLMKPLLEAVVRKSRRRHSIPSPALFISILFDSEMSDSTPPPIPKRTTELSVPSVVPPPIPIRPSATSNSSSGIPPAPSQSPSKSSSIPPLDVNDIARYYHGNVVKVWTSSHITISTNEKVFDKLYLHLLNRNVNAEHVSKLKNSLYATQGHADADPLEITAALLLDDYYASMADPTVECHLALLDGQHRMTAATEMIEMSRKTPGARKFTFVVCLKLFICENESILSQRIERINSVLTFTEQDKANVRVRNYFLEALHQLVGDSNRRRRAIQLLARSKRLRDDQWTRRLQTRDIQWFKTKLREIAQKPDYVELATQVVPNSARAKLIQTTGLNQLADETEGWLEELSEYPVTPVDMRRKHKVRKLMDRE